MLVVERRCVAAEQSSKSWGFCRQQGRDLRELPLMVESIASFTGLEEELGWDIGWQQGGNLALFEDEAKRASQARWAQLAAPFGVPTQIIDREGVEELLPGLGAAHPVQGAMWTSTDGSADPERATAAFAQGALAHGAQFLQGVGVATLATSQHGAHGRGMGQAGRVTGVVLDSGEEVSAGVVVVATAGWSDELLRKSVGLSLPTLRLHATAGRTEPLDEPAAAAPFPSCGVWSGECSFRLRPDGGLTLADGGHAEEHDLSADTLRHGWRFLPHLRQFWSQTHLKLRRDSLPHPRRDACPEPAAGRMSAAVEQFAALFPVRTISWNVRGSADCC